MLLGQRAFLKDSLAIQEDQDEKLLRAYSPFNVVVAVPST
jgi:hypothetical protein